MTWLKAYRNISGSVKLLILAEFFLQFANTSHFLILNFYLKGLDYSDEAIASLTSFRFLIPMIIAAPFGLLIPGKALLPFFRVAALLVPAASLAIVIFANQGMTQWVSVAMAILGGGFSILQIIMVPYILRNESNHPIEGIALHFTTWSLASVLVGLLSYSGKLILGHPIAEGSLLLFFTALSGLGGVIAFLPMAEALPSSGQKSISFRSYHWRRIMTVLCPGVIIAIGAGVTMPYINLYFLQVFGLGYEQFAILGSMATILVAIGSMYGPRLQRRFGNRIAISLTQSIAVAALIVLAVMESFAGVSWAIIVAMLCYLIRQPLMNMVNPILSNFTMEYVGDQNREITSAMQQAFATGAWFFSSQLFRVMRSHDLPYSAILLTTAGIYAVGVLWYNLLIGRSNRSRTN